MTCPKCQSDCWDNREKVAGGWKGPLRKCKDTNCGWVEWPPREKPSAPAAKGHVNGHPKWTWAQLALMYQRSLLLAAKHIPAMSAVHKVPFTTADLLAGAATIFIAATRDGVRDTPKPAPPPVTQNSDYRDPDDLDEMPF